MSIKIDDVYEMLEKSSILIWGYGREGKSTYRFIRKKFPNKKIWIADSNLVEIEDDYVDTFIISEWKEEYNKFDYIFKSPGISILGMPVDVKKLTSQTEIFLSLFKKQVIGITGTKGKSTTASLIYHIVSIYNKDIIIVGNIGIPCFDKIQSINSNTKIVFEFSCHQLEHSTHSPHIGIVLNLFQDHLDHYGSFEMYIEAKKNILKFQDEEDIAIINKSDIAIFPKGKYITASMQENADISVLNSSIVIEGKEIMVDSGSTLLIGDHNLYNIAIVYYITCWIGELTHEEFLFALKNFSGLPHRLQYISTVHGVKYYDDSISTTCNATIEAIKALKEVDTVLIGGKNRNIDYAPLIDYLLSSTVENVILMGETTPFMLELFRNKSSYKFNLLVAKSMKEAVALAKDKSKRICLLSPAAASYDQFKDFEERGMMFQKFVTQSE